MGGVLGLQVQTEGIQPAKRAEHAEGKAKYALFPVWLLSTSWRGENYLFAMNGQTGKFVGDLPVDKGAARKWMLGLTAALSAASYGVMWLLWLARIL